MPEILVWGAVVELLGLAALPLLRAAFGNRRDAALLSRLCGLALTAWIGWAMAAFLPGIPFSRRSLVIAGVLVAAASWRVARKLKANKDETATGPFWGPEETRAAVLFWAPTAVFLVIRGALPEILGQEKFMDLAFFNSLVRNRTMPPPDPWMAGLTINYYYWGYLLAAVLDRISGVATTAGYNLAIATFAGYSFSAAACLGFRLSAGRLRAALGAGFAAVFAGNLAGAFDAWRAPLGKGFDYWHASRVIGDGKTIDEFPFFTFFQADLHPHLLAYPFFLAALAMGHRVLEIPSRRPGTPGGTWRERLVRAWPVILLAFLAGTAQAANNWILPAVAILIVAVSVLRVGESARLPSLADAVWGVLRGIGVVLLSLVPWYAYTRSYALLRPKSGSVLAAVTIRSDLPEFLLFWGLLFAAVLVCFLPTEPATDEAARRRRDLKAALIVGATLLAALATATPALLAIGPLTLAAAAWTVRALKGREPDPGGLYLGLLLLLGFSIVGGCEFVYFRDSYGLDLQRMNTVFKFYNQAWPILGIPAAVLADRAWRAPGRYQNTIRAVLAAVFVLALFYPIDAALSRLRLHTGAFTIDGFPSLARRSPGDAAAISWLSNNAGPGSVVLEASGDPYSEFARISSHTGIPTVMGWANHEGLWRNNEQEVADRAALVKVFYEGANEPVALLFCQKYKVNWVVLGDLERKRYPTADRIASYVFLTPSYPATGQGFSGMTTVYAVHAGAAPAPGAPPPIVPGR